MARCGAACESQFSWLDKYEILCKLKENDPGLNALRIADNFMEENLRDGNSNDRTMKKKDGLGTKKLKKSLESSLNHFDSHADVAVEHGEKLKKNHVVVGSHDGKGKSISGMLAPAVPKKLWDGLLHLNSSITVSAVAFFKRSIHILETFNFN